MGQAGTRGEIPEGPGQGGCTDIQGDSESAFPQPVKSMITVYFKDTHPVK